MPSRTKITSFCCWFQGAVHTRHGHWQTQWRLLLLLFSRGGTIPVLANGEKNTHKKKKKNSACLHSSVYFNCTISCHFPMGVMQAFLQDPSKAFRRREPLTSKTKSFCPLSTLLSLRTNQMMCHFAVTVASETLRVSPQKNNNNNNWKTRKTTHKGKKMGTIEPFSKPRSQLSTRRCPGLLSRAHLAIKDFHVVLKCVINGNGFQKNVHDTHKTKNTKIKMGTHEKPNLNRKGGGWG